MDAVCRCFHFFKFLIEPLSAALYVCAALATSASVALARPRDPISDEEARARIQKLTFPPTSFAAGRPEETYVTDHYEDSCVETSAQIPIPMPNLLTATVVDGQAMQTISVWRPKASRAEGEDAPAPAAAAAATPAAIVVPTIEGRSIIENRVAGWLCSAGIVAIIADVNHPLLPDTFPDWGLEDRHNQDSIGALHAIMDWASSESHIDPHQIGAVGISLGGVIASLWAGVEPRLKSAMIVAGGGNFPEILTLSTQAIITELRDKRMAAANLTAASQYEDELQKSILFDPVYFARFSTTQIKTVSGTADVTVPYADQIALWEAFGKPEQLLIDGLTHVQSIVAWAYLHMTESVDWLKTSLTREAPSAPSTIVTADL